MMNRSLIVFTFSLFCLFLSDAFAKRLSDPVYSDDQKEAFGELHESRPGVTSLTNLLESPEDYLNKSFTLNVEVAKVCQRKGCFFIAREGIKNIRVAFKDYSFFVPTDIDGKLVSLVGKLIQKEISQKQADHFASDMGAKSSAIKSGLVYEVVASSVTVPR